MVRQLTRGGYEVNYERVDEAEAVDGAMLRGSWDMVITDHNMPGFDSSSALQIVKEHDPDVPVIIVSGSIGEELAVEAMQLGANDYIMKDNLTRLAPAVGRELRETESRRDRRRAEEALHHLAYHDPLTGTNDWKYKSTSFKLKAGENPDIVKLNLHVSGKGTVWIDDISLLKRPVE